MFSTLVVSTNPELRLALAAIVNTYRLPIAGLVAGSNEALCLPTETRMVALVDLDAPGLQGPDTFFQLRRLRPLLPIVLLSYFVDEVLVNTYLSCGAQSFLCKDRLIGNGGILIDALLKAAKGETHKKDKAGAKPRPVFSQRQLQILPMWLKGCTSQHMARSLGISTRAIELQKKSMQQAVGVKATPAFFRLAFSNGWHYLPDVLPGS